MYGRVVAVKNCMSSASQKKRRKPSQENVSPVVLSKNEKILEQLRHVQWKCNCSTATLQCILDSLNAELGDLIRANDDLPKNVKSADKKMQEMVSLRTRK